jgi:DNA-binding transcriptional regulator YiaG
MHENTPDTLDSQARRPIPEYEDLYEIDRQGNVYAMFDYHQLKAGRVRKPVPGSHGYPSLNLSKNGTVRRWFIHRLLMLTFHPVQNSDQLQVNHRDGNKQNNDLNNLEWCSSLENNRHARYVLKAYPDKKGEKHSQAKLTPEAVREIRRLKANGVKQNRIAKMYNLSTSVISNVVNRKTWAHID